MSSLTATLTPSRRRRLFDFALALAVLLLALGQLGSQSFGEQTDAARQIDPAGVALCLLSAIPLLMRRRAPLAVLLIVLAATVALVGLDYAVLRPVAPAVALATLGERPRQVNPLRIASVTFAAFSAFVALAWARFGLEPGEYLVTALLWGGGWVIGDRRRLARQRAAQERERIEREQRLAVAEERSRIARELHDSAGHAINSILIQAGAARTVQESRPQGAREAIEAIEVIARETIEDLDGILGRLRGGGSAKLAPAPGTDRIADLVEHHRASGLDFHLVDRPGSGQRIPPAVDRAGYRIAQEALTNAARHGTGSAAITIDRRDRELRLTVMNPVGRQTAARAAGGHGIPGMCERAALLDGTFEAGRDDDSFVVRAALPFAGQDP